MDLRVENADSVVDFEKANVNMIALSKDNKTVEFVGRATESKSFSLLVRLTHEEIKAAYELSAGVEGMVM